MRRKQQQGVALVITLILLSVITFTAITFLVLSRREKGAVATSTDQTVAKLAAETGTERAQAEILSRIIAETNQFGYDFKVSTNYISPFGFDPAGDTNLLSVRLPNVSYRYIDGTPLDNAADNNQNIANLFYNPRPPVYVFTNKAQTGTADFRFYLDLNRNGFYDTNGLVVEMGDDGSGEQPILDDGGNLILNPRVGDPEWIGILERPDEPHGPDNRFVSRYATVVVPTGKTLDANRIHNVTARASVSHPLSGNLNFGRNMGVGTWEMNLAAFLTDLNTNLWDVPGRHYTYDVDNSGPEIDFQGVMGDAFYDAARMVLYRYQPVDGFGVRPFSVLHPAGLQQFNSDQIDGYGAGPFMTDVRPEPDEDWRRMGLRWPGDDNPQHYFSPSDFFDEAKVGADFASRLENVAITNQSTYNRYTFYRMLSQLGTDSGYENPDKININYDNKVWRNAAGIATATNFYPWLAVDFFEEATDKMLREYHFTHFRDSLGQDPQGQDYVNQVNLARNIPVVTNGVFVYTPSINRLLQLAANIYDASTNRATSSLPDFPTVFRPLFERAPPDDVYIKGWQVLDSQAMVDAALAQPLKDPFEATAANGRRSITEFDNVYGVPWIVGAKKGFPSFNELSVETIFEVTRKLEFRRPDATSRPDETNQMFLISINSDVGVEAWNSYRDDFVLPSGVTVYATNQLDVMVYLTNQPTGSWSANGWRNQPVGNAVTVPSWTGTGWGAIPDGDPSSQSFLAVIRTNFNVITNSIFRANGRLETQLSPAYDRNSRNIFPVPDITIAFTNRLQFVMVDQGSGRVLDYVHMRLGGRTNLTEMLAMTRRRSPLDNERARLWKTNRVGGTGISSPTEGIIRQIVVSLGSATMSYGEWRDYGFGPAAGQFRRKEQENFRDFITGRGTNLVMQAPFTPSRRITQYRSWQANDPLVHYTDGDLQQLDVGDGVQELSLTAQPQTLKNIGRLNNRYEPWGGNPGSSAESGQPGSRNTDPIFKDPLVRSSDNWEFPTNKFANVGWLGRVHRGTPWQTVYLKSGEIERRRGGAGREWRAWTGNQNRRDAAKTFPQEDRELFDLFTAAFNDNATAGQLSVNQDGLAAWSAVLSGVIALTNTTPDASWQNYDPNVVITNTPLVIPPAGVAGTNSALGRIVAGINAARMEERNEVFSSLGDVLKTEELTVESPFLNLSGEQRTEGITDAMYERVPQQIMGLLRGDEQPRYVIYSYGQALKPAERSLVTSGPFFGMCTNYQIMSESATRAVVRVDGAPRNPRVVLESFNVLPPD